MIRPRALLTAIASGLLGAFLLFGNAAAQVPGGSVGVKPPFVNGDCVKASGPGAISTTGAPCGGGGGSGTVTSVNVSGGTTGLTFSGGPVTSSGTITAAGVLDFANGGTGQSAYTDGQLLIGNTATGGLSKATITAGTNVTVTNGNGSITIAATGGGSGCSTAGSANQILTDNGSGGCASNAGFRYSSGTATVGTAGSLAGAFAFQNATSGTLTLAPPTGALGTVTVTVPAATDTLVNLAGAQTLTNKTITFADNTLTGVAPLASPTFTGVVTMPTPFTLGATSVTTTGTQINYLNAATGTTGTTSSNVVFSASPTFTGTVTTPALILNGSTSLTSASGNGAILVTSTGAQTAARCIHTDANGNHIIAAADCGSGNGSVTSVNVAGGTTGLTFSGGPVTTSGTITAAGTLAVANGGTGQTTYTDGQLLIGNTSGNTLSKATLTAGTNISITNGNGSITIASTGGGGGSAPSVQTTNFNAAAGGNYPVNTTGGAVTATLPASPSNGDTITFTDALQHFATANLILARNGLTIMNIAENLTVATQNANFSITYVSNGGVTTWIIN